jgi:pimeloyl-ACP methyl ester carboxylesterase
VLHTGAGGDSRMWQESGYVEGLRDFKVVLIDHCGHGESDAADDPGAYTPGGHAQDVLAVAEHLGLERFAFVGYSDGARVGFELAARSPLVTALVAIGGVDGPDDDPADLHAAAEEVRRKGIAAVLGDEPAPQWLLDNLATTDAEVVARELDGFAGWSPWPLFPSIAIPVLIVAGEDEAEHVDEAAAAMPDARAAVLPGLGHLGAFARSDLVLARVLPFLH